MKEHVFFSIFGLMASLAMTPRNRTDRSDQTIVDGASPPGRVGEHASPLPMSGTPEVGVSLVPPPCAHTLYS